MIKKEILLNLLERYWKEGCKCPKNPQITKLCDLCKETFVILDKYKLIENK